MQAYSNGNIRVHPIFLKTPSKKNYSNPNLKEYYVNHIAITSFPNPKPHPFSLTTRAFTSRNVQVHDQRSSSKGFFPRISFSSTKMKPEIKVTRRNWSNSSPDLKISKMICQNPAKSSRVRHDEGTLIDF